MQKNIKSFVITLYCAIIAIHLFVFLSPMLLTDKIEIMLNLLRFMIIFYRRERKRKSQNLMAVVFLLALH